MSKDDDMGKVLFGCGGIIVALILAVAIWVGRSYMEAATYSRITGSDVTTWEAMWVELRVQAGPANRD